MTTPTETTGLPPEVVASISISSAKSIGEQPAVLANLALANQIANINLAQQQALSAQQAMMQLTMATVAKCVEIITQIDAAAPNAPEHMKVMAALIESMMKGMNGGLSGQGAAAAAPPTAPPPPPPGWKTTP